MDLGFLVSCSSPCKVVPPPRPTPPTDLEEWWASQVYCVTVEEVPDTGEETDSVGYYVLNNGSGRAVLKVSHLPLHGAPTDWLGVYSKRQIVSFMELRQHFWAFQPNSWITYHVATVLEVNGIDREKLFILIERIDDRLEIMMGVGLNARSFMFEFRATRRPRIHDRCHPQPRQVLPPLVTVENLFDWIGTNLQCKWKPYHILQANCQHIAEELQGFIRDPAYYSRRQFERAQAQGCLAPAGMREDGADSMYISYKIAVDEAGVTNGIITVPSHHDRTNSVPHGSPHVFSGPPAVASRSQALRVYQQPQQDCIFQ